MLRIVSTSRGGAIKLGPASDFEAHFGGSGFEVEVVSLGGECKEATVWFGDLADSGISRRATCLPAEATWTDRDGPIGETHATAPLGPWAFDPDPALVRSGLLDGFAAAHGLARIVAGVDLLTGPGLVESPFLAAFEVVEVFPLDLKVLRREVASRGLGPLEIKTRGLDATPESYRAKLRPEGSEPGDLAPDRRTVWSLPGDPGPSASAPSVEMTGARFREFGGVVSNPAPARGRLASLEGQIPGSFSEVRRTMTTITIRRGSLALALLLVGLIGPDQFGQDHASLEVQARRRDALLDGPDHGLNRRGPRRQGDEADLRPDHGHDLDGQVG